MPESANAIKTAQSIKIEKSVHIQQYSHHLFHNVYVHTSGSSILGAVNQTRHQQQQHIGSIHIQATELCSLVTPREEGRRNYQSM